MATFYPLANPLPFVSYTALVWGPLAPLVHRATRGAKYGEPGYGLGFDEQLPAGATLADAQASADARVAALEAWQAENP